MSAFRFSPISFLSQNQYCVVGITSQRRVLHPGNPTEASRIGRIEIEFGARRLRPIEHQLYLELQALIAEKAGQGAQCSVGASLG